MPEQEPVTDLNPHFSSEGAVATPWSRGRQELRNAELYWLSTVRPDGRPHVTRLLGAWLDGAMHFCTGESERKAKNLVLNQQCILTTGRNTLEDGIDLVVEGAAERVTGGPELGLVADAFEAKYGARVTAPDGTWFGLGDAMRAGSALVYRVIPATVFGFGKGNEFSQTRWRFPATRS